MRAADSVISASPHFRQCQPLAHTIAMHHVSSAAESAPSNPVSQADISVIIPCLNEAESLPQLLQQLQSQTDITLKIIVADGGSRDHTIQAANTYGATVVHSPPGRGQQMNRAVTAAISPWLLFLHADSQLTSHQQLIDALRCMQQASQQSAQVAGHFALRFIDRPSAQRRWRILEYKTTLQKPLTINGDQGLLIRRDYFQQLGGFNTEHHFLEDQKLAAAIIQSGRWQLLPHRLNTSARRFETEGFHQRYWLMTLIMLAWLSGLKDFLAPSGNSYPNQANTKKLRLSSHVSRFMHLVGEQTLRQQLAIFWRIAGLCRSNIYQAFLWLDAFLFRRYWPLTRCWLATGDKLSNWPLLRPLTQLLLLPAFPIIATCIVLLAKIARQANPPSNDN